MPSIARGVAGGRRKCDFGETSPPIRPSFVGEAWGCFKKKYVDDKWYPLVN